MKRLGLYIHFPFCKRKCNYCDFYSCTSLEKSKEYIDSICKQLKAEAPLYKDYIFDTVFIGGGTPSLIDTDDFIRLSSTIKGCLNLSSELEFSIEVNPGTITKEKLFAYKSSGVNRISIGLQSTDDKELEALGRIHNYEAFVRNYNLTRECGFDNINIDIMYSLPNQKKEAFLETLDKVIKLNPEHISAYSLKIEENTPFGKMKSKLILPDEEEEYDIYISMCEALSKNGYLQYEISNFAKEGYECKHNLKYWLSEEYIGIGPSSHSYFNGERYSYNANLVEYVSKIKGNGSPTKVIELDEEDDNSTPKISKMDEYVMLKMRLSCGVELKEFYKLFQKEFTSIYPKISTYLNTGHVIFDNGAYKFTPKGFFVSNYILADILRF